MHDLVDKIMIEKLPNLVFSFTLCFTKFVASKFKIVLLPRSARYVVKRLCKWLHSAVFV